MKPQFVTDLRKWYITTYNDRFFTHPPAWFMMYMYMELIYHVPLSIWAIGALLRSMPDPMLRPETAPPGLVERRIAHA